ncbi:MOZ/SAS family protein [Teladorsagia circumcincta]|uniref:Histone acetyltransferase n=1 Tax=Teladorsagia circumcincta TaxID=45464 RepID=A0A2G9UJQ2_TELCI|nr:MOZ/SAS family protein [Teladorsagia circumcincta]
MKEMEVDKKVNLPKDKEQWVNFGGESDIKVLYESPYPDDIKSVPLFFICAYCLKPFSEQSSFFVHQDCCPRIAPPGREIYRESDSSLSFFEVDGAVEREKNPSRNNNLSCLLTIPNEQRNGYGHLLIDMSYQLSSIERKVGSPEHPLSDLGLFAYRKYWKSCILCYLRSRKDSTNISIKSMSLHTRIHPTDIVNELMRNNLLVMKDGNYFIKTWNSMDT